jgi:hypothetical protein
MLFHSPFSWVVAGAGLLIFFAMLVNRAVITRRELRARERNEKGAGGSTKKGAGKGGGKCTSCGCKKS